MFEYVDGVPKHILGSLIFLGIVREYLSSHRVKVTGHYYLIMSQRFPRVHIPAISAWRVFLRRTKHPTNLFLGRGLSLRSLLVLDLFQLLLNMIPFVVNGLSFVKRTWGSWWQVLLLWVTTLLDPLALSILCRNHRVVRPSCSQLLIVELDGVNYNSIIFRARLNWRTFKTLFSILRLAFMFLLLVDWNIGLMSHFIYDRDVIWDSRLLNWSMTGIFLLCTFLVWAVWLVDRCRSFHNLLICNLIF